MDKIFILDDDENRQEWFKKEFTHVQIVSALDIDEAVKKFNNTYKLILLDHDLGNRIYVPSEDRNTGYQFCKHLLEYEITCDILLHSMNSVGVNNMKNLLETKFKNIYLLDFGSLTTAWKNNELTVCGKTRLTHWT
jgi:hypothetical protein